MTGVPACRFYLHSIKMSLSVGKLLAFLYILKGINAYETQAYPTRNSSLSNFVPDIYKRTPDFIKDQGYPGEVHNVITDDGYILEIHRIPFGKFDDSSIEKSARRPVVLFMHGVQSNSDNWLLQHNISLPYLMADDGYDVWLGNSRGNSYGQKHVSLDPTSTKFWKFSFHEQGYYDLAAIIDYVLNTTKESKLFYLGHSKGSTIFYVLLSLKPEYNDKIHLALHLAPVVYLQNVLSPALQLAYKTLNPIAVYKFLQTIKLLHTPFMTNSYRKLCSILCGKTSPAYTSCWTFHFLTAGFDFQSTYSLDTGLIFSHFPDTVAAQELFHFLQMGQTGKFAMFDLGGKYNIEMYNSLTPPEYPLESVTAPIQMFYADNDFYVRPKDFNRLLRRIPNVVGVHKIPLRRFNHLDYVIAREARELVYEPVVKIFNNWDQSSN